MRVGAAGPGFRWHCTGRPPVPVALLTAYPGDTVLYCTRLSLVLIAQRSNHSYKYARADGTPNFEARDHSGCSMWASSTTVSLRDRTDEWTNIVERLQRSQVTRARCDAPQRAPMQLFSRPRCCAALAARPASTTAFVPCCLSAATQGASPGPYSQQGGEKFWLPRVCRNSSD
jgi:hypothetical protein